MAKREDNFSRFREFRIEFPEFIFEDYSYHLTRESLEIAFHFSLSGRYEFRPEIVIPLNDRIYRNPDELSSAALDTLIFHIGLIELVSYWKAACPPVIRIRHHQLLPGQASFWKRLYFSGLGEFFHMNSIKADPDNLVEFVFEEGKTHSQISEKLTDGAIVPVGGGKDSSVSMELLNRNSSDWLPFAINPGDAIRNTIIKAGKTESDTLVFKRKLDPQLIRLNEQGFLNGHTPFSALVAFYSLLAAYLAGRRDIILSNESSANEATIPGTDINHQYSKTYAFEKEFRDYCAEYVSGEFNYFSLLRPLSELQIARIFSAMPAYHESFRSCNTGSKSGIWCGACPKCLFSYIILAPFLDQKKLQSIFGHDLLDNPNLRSTFEELTGQSQHKPFECVGTVSEVRAACNQVVTNLQGRDLPYLLKTFSGNHGQEHPGFNEILGQTDPMHFVPEKYFHILKEALK